MTDPVFVAYATSGSPYVRDLKVLAISMQEGLGLTLEGHEIPDAGSWLRNVQLKAAFLRAMLWTHPGQRVVYLDADAIMLKRPELFWTLDADFGAHHLRGELLSGTLFLRDGPPARDLIDRWMAIQAAHPDRLPDGRPAWDQRCLALAVSRTPDLRSADLPPAYTYIVGLSQHDHPDVAPIILHTRGSFRYHPNHV